MSIKLFAPLAVAGSGLVASNSMWFFVSEEKTNPTHNVPTKVEVTQKTIPAPEKVNTVVQKTDEEKEINWLNAAPKLDRVTTVFTDSSMVKEEYVSGSGVYTRINKEEKRKYLSVVQTQLTDFVLRFDSKRKDYKNIETSEMKIKLFTTPAWYSTTFEDEYGIELDSDQIEEIFKLGDEVKIKQLLLSLHKKQNWKKLHEMSDYTSYWAETITINNLSPLKDLKIKYFKDFDGLKNYIQEKIKLCNSDNESCITNPEELDFMETDKPDFYKPQP